MPSHNHINSQNMYSNKLILGTPVYRQTTSTPNEVVTLDFDDTPVFVKRPETYQEAINIAKKEYPQLAHLSSARIGFALNDIVHGGRHVRVSESAWASITEKIPGGTIINVLVMPDPDAKLAPPEYLDVPVPKGNGSKDSLYSHSNSKRGSWHSSVRPKSSTGMLSWIGTGK